MEGPQAEAAPLTSASLAHLEGAQLPEPTSWLAGQALACPEHRTVGVPGTPSSGRAEVEPVLITTPATRQVLI